MEKFCYRCGALEKEKGPLLEGLCRDCFLAENPLIKGPDKAELKVCDQCGAYYVGNDLHDLERSPEIEYLDAAEEIAVSKLKVLQSGPTGISYENLEASEGVDIEPDAEYTSPGNIKVEVDVLAKLFDSQEEPLSDRIDIDVKVKKERCKVCERIRTGYYEAVLQVRGRGDLQESTLSEILRILEREFFEVRDRSRDEFVSKVKRKHGGLDLYASSSKLAEDMARFLKNQYGGEMDKSAELIGQTEDGEEKYRTTVVARLPF